MNTVAARQIQREYKKVLKKANQLKEPIVVVANNRPLGAIIGLDLLEKIQLDLVLRKAMEESRRGETMVIDTPEKLKESFVQMRDEVKIK